MKQTQLQLETPYFTLHLLAEGVYAAIAKSGTGAWSNAGFIDLGDEVLVFDAFSTPKAARELRKQAEKITNKPVKYLINSHFHGDHTFGNVAFEDVAIISTAKTRELHGNHNRVTDVEKEQEEMQHYLQDLRDKIQATTDPFTVIGLTRQLEEMTQVMESLPELKLVLPTMIFAEKLVLHGSKRTVELYCLGGGHTESDAFLYLPQEKIAFMGDLVTENTHAPIYDPIAFIKYLERLATFEIAVSIPGHGEVGTIEQHTTMTLYLKDLVSLVQDALQNGSSLEQILQIGTPAKYAHYTGPNGDKRNITTVYNHLVKSFAAKTFS